MTLLPYAGWAWLLPWYVYLPSVGTSLLFTVVADDVVKWLPLGVYRGRVVAAGLALWLGALVLALQRGNEHERRAGIVTRRVVRELAAAVPAPAPGTLFAISGMGRLGPGGDPWVKRKVFVFGLSEAVRLRFGDRTLSVYFVNKEDSLRRLPILKRLGKRPVAYLRSDEVGTGVSGGRGGRAEKTRSPVRLPSSATGKAHRSIA